jgi:hypothetical protein
MAPLLHVWDAADEEGGKLNLRLAAAARASMLQAVHLPPLCFVHNAFHLHPAPRTFWEKSAG